VADRIPVLLIAGTGRTGSTLVGNLLGSTPGAVSIGEVRHIWIRGVEQNWACGCGKPFHACPFWGEVLNQAFGGTANLDIDRLRMSERRLLRLRASPGALRWIRRPELLRAEHGYYMDTLEGLYRAIAAVSGAEVIVDSSKTPSYAALVSTLTPVDLRVLHLVRDPRAAAHSWLNPKPSPDRSTSGAMDRIGAAKSAVLWAWWNGLSDRLWAARSDIPAMRVRYETLTAAPEAILQSVRDRLIPETAGRPLAVVGDTAELSMAHTVSGNPDRMRTGAVTITPDERWRTGLATHHRAAVLTIAGPKMLQYGYGRRNR